MKGLRWPRERGEVQREMRPQIRPKNNVKSYSDARKARNRVGGRGNKINSSQLHDEPVNERENIDALRRKDVTILHLAFYHNYIDNFMEHQSVFIC